MPDLHLELGRADPVEWMPRVHGNAEFFQQFSFQRFSRSLTEFNMAARKIPDIRVPPAIWRAMAQENPTFLDHRASHDRLGHQQIVNPHRDTQPSDLTVGVPSRTLAHSTLAFPDNTPYVLLADWRAWWNAVGRRELSDLLSDRCGQKPRPETRTPTNDEQIATTDRPTVIGPHAYLLDAAVTVQVADRVPKKTHTHRPSSGVAAGPSLGGTFANTGPCNVVSAPLDRGWLIADRLCCD